MRIITGKHKGRQLLDCKKLKDLRPTTDKNRENLFNLLSSARFLQDINFNLQECENILDVFSGSGSISFEALSRGVKSATLIDKNYPHIELSKKNAQMLGEEKNCHFLQFDLTKPLFRSDKSYKLIFIDPPYNQSLLEKSLENLLNNNFINPDSLVIIEHSSFEKIDLQIIDQIGLQNIFTKEYSKTIFSFFITKK